MIVWNFSFFSLCFPNIESIVTTEKSELSGWIQQFFLKIIYSNGQFSMSYFFYV